jgi:dipeptidyl aminopeptidase/acylaminoacyl peptidase
MERHRISRRTILALGTITLSLVVLGFGAATPARAGLPPLIPREVIFGNPERTSPQLSPDGMYFTYLAPEEGVLNVWLRTVGMTDDRALTHDRGRGIRAYFWGQNNQRVLYIQDKDGDENWHVFSVDLAGGEPRDLTPFEKVQAQIVSVDPQFPDVILVGLNNRVPQLHDVYRVNIMTGESTLEAQNDMGSAAWVADNSLRVRIALLPTPDGGFGLLHRSAPDAEWKDLTKWGNEDAMTTAPFGFAADNSTLYMVSSVGANTAELRTYDVTTGQEKTVYSDPNYDVSNAMIHPTTHVLQAVAVNRDKEEWKVLDPSIEADFAALAKLHEGEFQVTGRDLADKTWLVVFSGDKGPAAFYSYDRASKKGTFLFTTRPKLEGLSLAEMRPVAYTSRDGMTVHGYLSLPPGVEPKNLPTVINVHGGPWYRDGWGYHPEAQWLANRGYACLQINFRGSTGYGKAFTNAGDREWGGNMQNDISDGVKWMLDQGYADPKRIAIYGGSYGGYAVLTGLTKTPELYACGVDIVGPSNLITFLNTIPPYWEPMKPLFYKRIGDPVKDEQMLKDRSPLFHIDAIRAPLLIGQGANDPRVNRAESLQIRDALQQAGKIVQYIEFPDEGHGFARPANRITFYAAAEKFLAEHIGGRFEPAAE